MPARETARPRVVLVGAGHAHLYTLARARAFAERGADLIAVAPDAFWYSGLATGMLGGFYPPDLDRVDVAALVIAGGGRFVQAEVTGFDLVRRRLLFEDRPPLPFDVLSLTLGSEPPVIPGDDGPDSYTVKPISCLWDLRRDLERRFNHDPDTRLRVVVAGGGASACEIAANVAALARRRGGDVDLNVLHGHHEPLGQLPPRARERVVRVLRRRGIRFTSKRVTRLGDHVAVCGPDEPEPFDLFVNAAGLKPARILRRTGLPMDEAGGLRIDSHLRSLADPRVHAAGDCASLEGHSLARVGVYAIRQAPVLFANLLASVDDSPPEEFVPQKNYLWILNLGDGTGLAVRGGFWWHGRAAHWLKDRIDRRFVERYQGLA